MTCVNHETLEFADQPATDRKSLLYIIRPVFPRLWDGLDSRTSAELNHTLSA